MTLVHAAGVAAALTLTAGRPLWAVATALGVAALATLAAAGEGMRPRISPVAVGLLAVAALALAAEFGPELSR